MEGPEHLSPSSKALYERLVDDYALGDEVHALATLTLALEALDRCEQARVILAREGITYTDRFGQPRKHPCVSVEENARLQAVRCFRELSLDSASGEANARPPRIAWVPPRIVEGGG